MGRVEIHAHLEQDDRHMEAGQLLMTVLLRQRYSCLQIDGYPGQSMRSESVPWPRAGGVPDGDVRAACRASPSNNDI